MEDACGRLLDTYRDGETRNIHRDMTDLCFEVLARSLFGEDLPEARELVAATAEALHAFHHLHSQWIGAAGGLVFAGVRAVATALGRPDFVLDPSLLPTSYSRQFREAVRALDAFVAALVARKRREPPGDDFLSLLLGAVDAQNAPPGATSRSADEIVTMFLAGHETAASSLTWTLYLLARHPDGGAGPGHPGRPAAGERSYSSRSPARVFASIRRHTGSAALRSPPVRSAASG